jgi:hypothetical protein
LSRREEELLRQEVRELTELMRVGPGFGDFRNALTAAGIAPENCLLAGFVEDEEENEFGALVTVDGRIFVYERNTAAGASGFKGFKEMPDPREAAELYPAVEVALSMLTRRVQQPGLGVAMSNSRVQPT